MDLIAVVTIHRNNQKELFKIFEELKLQSYKNWLFFVVDDNSDNIKQLEAIDDPQFKLIKFPPPFEFAYAKKFNYGFKASLNHNPKYIFKIHTDMSLTSKNLIRSLAAEMDKDDSIAAVGPKIFNLDNVVTWGPGITKSRCGHEYTVHESYMIRTDYLVKHNGYHDEIFTWFGEEMDFFSRMYKYGFKTSNVNESLIHFGGATSSHFSAIKKYHRTRSTLLFLHKHNKKYSFYKNLKWYLEEIRNDFKEGLSFLKQGKLKNFFLNYYFMTKGFFSALLIIISGKIKRI